MNDLDFNQLSEIFYIYEDLTPDKLWKTYVAFYKNSDFMNPVVIKEMDYKRACIYQSLCEMWNPYIANVYSVHHLPNTKINDDSLENVYIAITENAGEISLSDYVYTHGPLDYRTALTICVQLCEGLSDFHKKGFVHRDIKPDNIMMFSLEPNIHIKIIDFGAAKEFQNNKAADTTVIGTLGYQSPESLSSVTTTVADIFSVGCVLNFMLTGQDPGIRHYTEKHEIVNIIEKATNVDPSGRYSSVEEFKKILLHELRFYSFDRIPIIRSIPGFRTHTVWKMTLASVVYIAFTYLICIELLQKLFIEALMVCTFWIFIPLIVIFNLGNLLRFIPQNIRRNSKKMFIFRLIATLISFLAPFSLLYFLA